MTLIQGIKLGQLAKAKGRTLRTENGKVQFVAVSYDKKGLSTVAPQSRWMTFDEALAALQ